MRVTAAGQTQAIIARLLESQSKLAEAQDRATTGLKVAKMSDDPTSASTIVRDASALRGIAQYTRNAEGLNASLDAEDSALQQLNDLLIRAKELGTGANSSTAGAAGRGAAAAEVRQLLTQAVGVANTKVGTDFVFGGTSSDGRPPFDAASATFVPDAGSGTGGSAPRYPTGVRPVDVGPGGQTLDGSHDGTSVFLAYTDGVPDATRGVLPSLQQLAQAISDPDPAKLTPALAALGDAFDALQVRVGELGARQNQAAATLTSLAAAQSTLSQHKSGLSEVDMEQAITEMLARQTAYQSAMLASSKIMGLSLTEYLR